jgi:hypothetical protein
MLKRVCSISIPVIGRMVQSSLKREEKYCGYDQAKSINELLLYKEVCWSRFLSMCAIKMMKVVEQ